MKKLRGIRVGKTLLCVWRWVRRRRRRRSNSGDYLRLGCTSSPSPSQRADRERTAMAAKIAEWARLFSLPLRPSPRACLSGGGDEYGGDYQLVRQRRPKPPPKGHLVVYVARDGGERPHRAVVPVVYFNHPLFGELLRKAEREFGFQQSGGITIPCPVSDFEGICTTVAAEFGRRCRRRSGGSSAAGLPRQLLSLTGRRPIV